MIYVFAGIGILTVIGIAVWVISEVFGTKKYTDDEWNKIIRNS